MENLFCFFIYIRNLLSEDHNRNFQFIPRQKKTGIFRIDLSSGRSLDIPVFSCQYT